ncbi:MAG: sulfotransferase [Actinomycetota bacterium]
MNTLLKLIPPIWSCRNILRYQFFRGLNHLAEIDDTRLIISNLLRSLNIISTGPELTDSRPADIPYIELRRPTEDRGTRFRDDIIFVTGRFRSGSSLIWNLFRNMPSVTAFYEPFNERRWFDKSHRGTHVDPTHSNITEYWSEYEGLEVLSNYYDENWTRRQLYMNSEAWKPAMQRYIEILIESAKGRPVLQFNRTDLRLPWLKARFPHSKILHIFRHPRDQWCSTLIDISRLPRSGTLREFEAVDGFYLLRWARDLQNYFPFLTTEVDKHPYEIFYSIWKLSYVFGRNYADVSIAFEDLISQPTKTIENMLSDLSFDNTDVTRLVALVRPASTGKWNRYGDHEWFSAIEAKVDNIFHNFFAKV